MYDSIKIYIYLLLFKLLNLFHLFHEDAKVTDIISTTSSFSGKQIYCCYEIEVKVKGLKRSIVVEEQEIKRYKRA